MSTATAPRPAASVIVADGNHDFAHWLVRTLEARGLHLRWTPRGEEALRWAGEHAPQMVFVNAFLEDMLGFEVIERLRQAAPRQGPSIVLIGAIFRTYRYHSTPRQLYGADAYIEEGVTEKELFDVVEGIRPGLWPQQGAPPQAPRLRTRKGGTEEESLGAEPVEAAGLGIGGAHEARTLAEIIISDIYIYKPIRARRAILKGRFEEAFADELRIGRDYFRKRFPGESRDGNDVFREALDDFLALKKKEYEERP